jgi:hypothetical protein
MKKRPELAAQAYPALVAAAASVEKTEDRELTTEDC